MLFPLATSLLLLASCSVTKKISQSAKADVLSNKAFVTAHTGISIYEPATGKTWYDYQGDKYFVPASNTKLPTCYAAMKYLGDSILSFFIKETEDSINLIPAGDPSFLNSEFPEQDLFNYLKKSSKTITVFFQSQNNVDAFGSGWSWNDYQEYYMAERSPMPVYGNVITFQRKEKSINVNPPIVLRKPYMDEPMMQLIGVGEKFKVTRSQDENKFSFAADNNSFRTVQIPYKTNRGITNFNFLKDTLNNGDKTWLSLTRNTEGFKKVFSIPTDSLLKITIHRSDNFFAEQCILMTSVRIFGYMDDDKTRDTLLKTDFKELPQPPRWADGSGLSRYNLFSPRDFVTILDKMRKDFGMNRMKVILATGGEGTISSYYKADSGYIYGKTGTLSGVVAFSGYLYTKKGKLLIFSTLVNNHRASATDIRRAIEKFLEGIRNKY